MNFRGRFLIVVLLFTVSGISLAAGTEPLFVKFKTDKWVSEQMGKMSLEEKIAQLMTIAVYPDQGIESKNKILEQIKLYNPGGILVMQGKPEETVKWINDFQQKSKIPLLIAIDGEWGISMRIDSVMKFPYAQTIGAVQDSTFIYQMGRDYATQLKMMGIHVNFAPVADINTNSNNPVINFRAFGEDKSDVAKKAWWVAKGMQDAGVIPVAKHFPGHGDTDTDSHKILPFLTHSKARMDSLETYPFRYLSDKGIIGIMTAHLNVASIDNSLAPSSLSKKIVTGYLKNEIGFKGFVVTDAINMKGVRTDKGNAEVEALIAGNDMIEFVPDLPKAIQSVKTAINEGKLSIAEINEKCITVLALKRWVNLNEYKPAETENLTVRLNSPLLEVTNRKLIKGSLTVLKNMGILPIQGLDTLKIASLIIGSSEISPFQKMLEKYTQIDHFALSKNATEKDWTNIRAKLKDYNLVISGIQGINIYPAGKYGVTEIQRKAVAEIIQDNNSVFVFFGNAYAIKHFETIHHTNGLIVAYQNTPLIQELAAQLIFGAFDASGKLPVTIDNRFKLKDGIEIKRNNILAYTIPEEMGIKSELLEKKIDSLAYLGITQKAYPGCQVLIAKNGNVIFHKTYGYQTYDKNLKVSDTDIYDWASITKVTGPLPAIMKLVDEKKLDVEQPLSKYWPDFINSNKENIKISEFLTHQSGIPAWIPFWQMAANKKGELNPGFFQHKPTDGFRVRVSENLYLKDDFRKLIYDTIRNSKVGEKKYVYSDLSFHIYPEVIAKLTGENYEDYLKRTFYRPLGATTITYNPYLQFTLNRIIPTETDEIFRKQTIRGFVHDEGAAMLGGVSGNAGLFGSANDLAKLFQMYLQKGYYGGKRYIEEETINHFIKPRFPENGNRRALGFDKPFLNNGKPNGDSYPAKGVSNNSFGHSGFTGTFVWADPDNGLLYIFLSNRVYPTRDNSKLFDLNIRSEMLQQIYDCTKTGLN
ncbi:MAG TPA: glycoside hydrolase family 3 N-terminal domain-containing protein [Draconibacterium sp.]|nr:glycoside hydrolase family 3 N-terminal domain-containing protein [Draconibacterium sp.]